MVSDTFMECFDKPLQLTEGRTGHLIFGAQDLWIRCGQKGWYVASDFAASEDRTPVWCEEDAPASLTWERWVTGKVGVAPRLRLHPPDRPLVVRPEAMVKLLPGESVAFFIGVPLWVGLDVESQALGSYATAQLSSSWFGTPQEGVLCYSMRSSVHADPDLLKPRNHRCICPLQVKNASDEILNFERVCLRSQYLAIYQGTARYWTNAARLSYRGRQEWSRIVYARSAPAEAGPARLVSASQWAGMGGFKMRAASIMEKVAGSL